MEVRDPEVDLRRMRIRLGVAMLLTVFCFGLLAARFYYLQVVRFTEFHSQAEDNRITLIPVPPQRGQITDRTASSSPRTSSPTRSSWRRTASATTTA